MELDPTLLTWAFVVGGLLLMLIETFVPGGIAFFLGAGGLMVAGLRALGLLADPLTAIMTWIFLSTGLTIALRPIALRIAQGEISLALTDEDAEAIGQTVTVVEPVGEHEPGRIRFRGASWDARTLEGRLPKGAKATLLYRDNLTWVVEPADHSDLDAELADALKGEGSDSGDQWERTDGTSSSEDSELGYDPSIRPSQ